MWAEYIFPIILIIIILIILDVCAAIVYASNGDWKHFGYWMSAASISTFALLM